MGRLTVVQEQQAKTQLLMKINEYMSRAEYIKELENKLRLQQSRAQTIDAAVGAAFP